jgi:hypothetical protein
LIKKETKIEELKEEAKPNVTNILKKENESINS